MLSEKVGCYPIKNLNSIKIKINELCSYDINNLKILKAYIERSITNNVYEQLGKIFIALLIATGTAISNIFFR